ncbi:MAG TPA: PKD domain-containing protein, partial [Solirubrobacteraceae bacterium]|nr:PKD domain-containing protein [Solirubrobacteraceae bacterium]
PAALPSVVVAGTVSIDPSAALNLVVTPGIAVPHGSKLVLIGNDASDPISGQFTGVPNGSVLTTPDGVPLVVNYADGDGNDLELTAGNVPPQAGSVTVTPNPVVAGQPVALTVTASDANQDPLTTTWSFGDGSTGTGAATSHTYATPGMYTAVATVSDGVAQVQSTIVINVSAPTTGGGTGAHPGGGTTAPATTSTVKSSAYGADFRLTVPRACVRKGKAFHVTLSVKRQVKAKGNVLAGVTKVVFTIGLRAKTDRFAPFGAELTIARGATGRRIKLGAKAYLRLHNRSRRTKSLVAVMKVC